MAVHVRQAIDDDAAAIAVIYNEGIASGWATFETEPRSGPDIASDMRARTTPLATLVAEVDGEVVGAAWLDPYSARACYRGVADFSVYLASQARGLGLGSVLLAALLQHAQTQGLHKVVGKVVEGNAASLALCRRLGFREVGVHRRHGRLDGSWRDVVVVERLLGAAAD